MRVMVMRVELLTHADEARDVARALDLGSSSEAAQAQSHFRAHGRFAEPRLRRALSLLGARAPAAASGFLTEIEGPNVAAVLGE